MDIDNPDDIDKPAVRKIHPLIIWPLGIALMGGPLVLAEYIYNSIHPDNIFVSAIMASLIGGPAVSLCLLNAYYLDCLKHRKTYADAIAENGQDCLKAGALMAVFGFFGTFAR